MPRLLRSQPSRAESGPAPEPALRSIGPRPQSTEAKWDLGPSKVPPPVPFLRAMEANRTSDSPRASGVLDHATLFLCRQGQTWVVVLESPHITAAQLLRRAAHDSYDARVELLSRARLACPDAAIESADGALEGADYEWRIEVRGERERLGELGAALQSELSGRRTRQRHQRRLIARRAKRNCRAGWFPSFARRPLSF